jgi:hypothetical protein
MTSRATPSELVSGIAPGSIPSGDRATLEQGLTAGAAGSETGRPNPLGGPSVVPVDNVDDPLAALMSGELNPGPSGPITEGLSVGPGAGPANAVEDPRIVRVRQIALQAKSPTIRAVMRNELRRMSSEAV